MQASNSSNSETVICIGAVIGVVRSGGKPCVVKIVRKMSDYYDLAKIEVNVLEKLKELDPDGKQ